MTKTEIKARLAELTAKVESVRRLTNSVNGNPRWSLYVIPDGVDWGLRVQTSSDASCSYDIGQYSEGRTYVFSLTPAMRIAYAEEVKQ